MGTSVSRVGGKTQLRVLRDASGTMRLDYALLNGVLAARCAAHARLVRDEETDRLSDHYPLVVDLSCADSEGS